MVSRWVSRHSRGVNIAFDDDSVLYVVLQNSEGSGSKAGDAKRSSTARRELEECASSQWCLS